MKAADAIFKVGVIGGFVRVEIYQDEKEIGRYNFSITNARDAVVGMQEAIAYLEKGQAK